MGNRDHKRSLRQKMQDFMSTSRGQVILNYAYNWGAAIVIMGALFKLTHLSGANAMLFLGMGTEVLIFFISAFDLSGVKRDEEVTSSVSLGAMVAESVPVNGIQNGASVLTSGSVVPAENISGVTGPSVVVVQSGGGSMQPGVNVQPGVQPVYGNMQPIGASAIPVQQPMQAIQPSMAPNPGSAPVTPEMEEATAAYLEQLKAMTEMLSRCTDQAQMVSHDTEQMNLLSKNLAGINAIYEMQLRSVSTQIGTIDQVHEQTRRMARQIEELNEVYARMLRAMTSSNN